MCPDPLRPDPARSGRVRHGVLALGLILPLATAGVAAAQSRPGWVDPPAKTTPAKTTPAQTAPPVPVPADPAPSKPEPGRAAAPEPAVAEAGRDAAAMAGPSRRAERPRMRRGAARRLAGTPAASAFPTAPPITGPAPREAGADPRASDRAGQAQALAGDYLAVFSAPVGAMVAGAPRFYGARLRFHGRMTTLAELLAEKRRFAQRWPERRYAPRTVRTACDAALESCIVRAIVDFRAGSPARGARAQGVAELVLEVSFPGGRAVIVSESSRVLRRGAAVGALAGGRASG
ncbi:hypothetical protein [uncultured Methylobacterium sp.]|uniref:hypothetical protein n=1 Tax=uncultured Methylobacterium sp. TaxID=157278 RepID=UPI0035CBD4A8